MLGPVSNPTGGPLRLLLFLSSLRRSVRPEAGGSLPHPLLARTVALLPGSQFPGQTALGGRHGLRGGRRQGLAGEGRSRRSEYQQSGRVRTRTTGYHGPRRVTRTVKAFRWLLLFIINCPPSSLLLSALCCFFIHILCQLFGHVVLI